MTDTTHLALPFIEGSQAQKHVTHNEALRILDTLVMLAVDDRDLAAPPASPVEGARYLVKATGTGAFAGKDNQIATYIDGEWWFFPPQAGWTCFVRDEGVLLAYSGAAWGAALDILGGISDISNLSHLGIATTADNTNPLSAKLNNALFTARTVAEGGDGNLRHKMSKAAAANTASLLMQTAYSGRAEIGLAGDDDLHIKVSPDGSNWTDALTFDRNSGAAKFNAGLFLTGDITPAQLTADQNDYNPAGLANASVLRLSGNASRNLTGLSGGGDGRIVTIVNVGSNALVLKDANASSSVANRFSFGADVTLAAKQSAVLLYDATDTRWKLLAGPSSSSGAPADLDITLAELAMQAADSASAALFLGAAGNRFADSFKALTYVDIAGATNLDSGTAGVLKPTIGGTGSLLSTAGKTLIGDMINNGGRAAAFDGNANQSASASAAKGVSASGYGNTIGVDWGAGNAYVIDRVKLWCPNDNTFIGSGGTTTFRLRGSNDGSTWVDLYTSGAVGSTAGSVDVTSGITKTTAYRYHQIDFAGNAVNSVFVAEVNFFGFVPVAQAISVSSSALAAATVPTSIKVVARAKLIDSITLGTDLIFEVSRDGGTTWTAASMSDRFTSPSPVSGIHVLESAAADVSGQPSGTSVKWRCRNANNKNFELHDIALTWA